MKLGFSLTMMSLLCFKLSAEPVQFSASPVKFSRVASNISYAQAAALEFRQPDEKVSYGPDPLQFGLLWRAQPRLEQPRLTTKPLIVFIHGGCWLSAYDVKHTYPLASALSQSGYPVWSLEYRRTGDPGGGWPGTFNDIMLALQQLEKLQAFDIDASKIILIGHSSGGHLALLAAAKLQQDSLNISRLKSTIGLAAITDIKLYSQGNNSCQAVTPQFMQGSYLEQPQAYQDADVVSKKIPKSSLLMHGDADDIVPLPQSRINGITQLIVKGAGHFDWIHPGSDAFALLLKTLDLH